MGKGLNVPLPYLLSAIRRRKAWTSFSTVVAYIESRTQGKQPGDRERDPETTSDGAHAHQSQMTISTQDIIPKSKPDFYCLVDMVEKSADTKVSPSSEIISSHLSHHFSSPMWPAPRWKAIRLIISQLGSQPTPTKVIREKDKWRAHPSTIVPWTNAR